MTTPLPHQFVENLIAQVKIPDNGTLSTTVYQDEHVKVVLFAFSAGQELSEHTASMPAILQQYSGRFRWSLGGDIKSASPGAWAYMPSHLPHSIYADEPGIMLLTLLKSAKISAKQI